MDVGELLAEEINSSAVKNKPRVTDISTFEEIENKKGNYQDQQNRKVKCR